MEALQQKAEEKLQKFGKWERRGAKELQDDIKLLIEDQKEFNSMLQNRETTLENQVIELNFER